MPHRRRSYLTQLISRDKAEEVRLPRRILELERVAILAQVLRTGGVRLVRVPATGRVLHAPIGIALHVQRICLRKRQRIRRLRLRKTGGGDGAPRGKSASTTKSSSWRLTVRWSSSGSSASTFRSTASSCASRVVIRSPAESPELAAISIVFKRRPRSSSRRATRRACASRRPITAL